MTSSSSPFANNTGKLQVLPSPTTLLFTQSINNNVTINNMGNTTQNIRQTNIQNGTIFQQPMSSGIMTTPTSIVRVNQPQTIQQQSTTLNHGQFVPQTLWTNNIQQTPQHQFTLQKQPQQQLSGVQYAPVKNEPVTISGMQSQPSVIQSKVITQPVIRQTVTSQQTTTSVQYTESQINDFVSKCRTFLTTLLRLAEKQAPEKLPMVRSCIQELLDGTIDPESFTQRLHTLYKSQPHISLVPFFKLALPHMRQIVQNTFGRPITIDLLEKLQLPTSNSNSNNNNINVNNNNNNTTNTIQVTNSNIINQSLLNHHHHQQQQQQQQHTTPVIQQPLYTTVQPQQKINILQSTPQQTLLTSTPSLLSQQQQQQQQARQISITATGGRSLVTSLSGTPNTSLLSGQQPIQPVTQMIIQQSDSLSQRSFLSTTTTLQQPKIITVNPQLIKTETIHSQPSPLTTISAIQQKTIIKTEDDTSDDNYNVVINDTRHITHDDRLISTAVLRRRLHELAEKDKRMAGMIINDDAAFALISNATQERLKYIIEQVKLIAQHRIDMSMKNDSSYEQTSDVKGQIRFLEDLDKIEKQKKDKLEQEKIFRAAKSRAKTNDPEAVKLKQKAKEMQQAQFEEQRQKEANETALAAIGKPKKRKLEESTNHLHQPIMPSNGPEQMYPIQPSPSAGVNNSTNIYQKSRTAKRICRANLRDLLVIMERDKYLKRTTLLVRALNMTETIIEKEKEKESSVIENETDGLETACYRKCHGQFCLTPTVNHFEHEISLDFSPFIDSLTNYSTVKYERIESLLKLDHSIDRVKNLILNKHITCTDLCLYYLKRVQMTNNYYKVIIELNPHLLSEAKQLDEQVNNNTINNQLLLFGCVAGVKGNISIRDMYNDAGAYVLHENKMKDDAPVVQKLREQGCIILGRTNLSEWAYGFTENAPSGFSAVGGQCLHPDDIHEDVSGSSSGSAAGIKLHLFTFSLGTETQGSLLSPAINVRNVCALKPSLGTWPKQDIIPINYDQDSCGPLTRCIKDVELLHRIVSGIKEDNNNYHRSLRVGYLGQSQDGIVLFQALSSLLPLTTLINLNSDLSLAQPIASVLNPTSSCSATFQDFLCYALSRDIPSYLSNHSSYYSHQTLSSIIEWNSSHSQYIPYGQSLFIRAIESPITQEAYNEYKKTIQESFQSLVNYLKSTYSLDCLVTIGNDDIFAGTTICGIPRANLTLDYYNPEHRQINVVVIGFSHGDDLLLLRFLQRLEKANLQVGKIDTRTLFQKYIQYPIRSVYNHGCSIL
ncbi:unnamed protein product [Rotaria sp. Silwood1]|nr:unnamed protein product [Rotaria sp. Silwood1]CAF3362715.1 unnamed protein product [Rotaria sp. Silwood1]CAF4671426.1 unnamed protein product [Rotaria sp. Silwood1]CAF4754289.1 unnamed protein product [Rotaria sp. Silwood1]